MRVLFNLLFLSSLAGGAAGADHSSKSAKAEALHPAGNTRASSSVGSFRDGVYKGGEEAEKIWEDNGSDCGYVFSYQDDVDD